MHEKEILFNTKTVFYRITGQGPLVVLLHGFGEDGTVWKGQYDIFPGHTLLVPDLPGSGRSQAVHDMSMEGMADVIKAILEAENRNRNITMIGHSMGGYITLAFAERYPEWLLGFGLFHSTAFADSAEKKETRQKAIRFIRETGAEAFLQTATLNLYAPASKEQHPEWISAHLEQVHNFSAENLVSYYMAMIERPNRTAILQNSPVPVLFVMGRHDTAVPLADGLKQCYLPHLAYIHILEHSGHMGMVEEELAANAILSQFVFTIEKPVLTS